MQPSQELDYDKWECLDLEAMGVRLRSAGILTAPVEDGREWRHLFGIASQQVADPVTTERMRGDVQGLAKAIRARRPELSTHGSPIDEVQVRFDVFLDFLRGELEKLERFSQRMAESPDKGLVMMVQAAQLVDHELNGPRRRLKTAIASMETAAANRRKGSHRIPMTDIVELMRVKRSELLGRKAA